MKKESDYVTITLPRATGKEEDVVFVGLNGKGYTIRRGVAVRVPRPVYEILAESQRQEQRQRDQRARRPYEGHGPGQAARDQSDEKAGRQQRERPRGDPAVHRIPALPVHAVSAFPLRFPYHHYSA